MASEKFIIVKTKISEADHEKLMKKVEREYDSKKALGRYLKQIIKRDIS